MFDDRPAIIENQDVRPSTALHQLFLNDFWGRRLTDVSEQSSLSLSLSLFVSLCSVILSMRKEWAVRREERKRRFTEKNILRQGIRSSYSRSSGSTNASDSSGKKQVSVLRERKDDHFLVMRGSSSSIRGDGGREEDRRSDPSLYTHHILPHSHTDRDDGDSK